MQNKVIVIEMIQYSVSILDNQCQKEVGSSCNKFAIQDPVAQSFEYPWWAEFWIATQWVLGCFVLDSYFNGAVNIGTHIGECICNDCNRVLAGIYDY